jgi:ATP-dependent protease ClpP protease subunit
MANINIFGEIFGTEEFSASLALAPTNEPLTVTIGSVGGSVVDGFTIAAQLAQHEGDVTTLGVGFVASVATVILLAGNRVELAADSFLMIHNSWTYEQGNAKDLKRTASQLETIDKTLANVYLNQIEKAGKLIDGDRGKTLAVLRSYMSAEKWFSAEEALNFGLIDAIADKKEQAPTWGMDAAALARVRASLTNFSNIPTNFINNMDKQQEKSFLQKLANFFGFKAQLEEVQEEQPKEIEEPQEPKAEAVADEPQAAQEPTLEERLATMQAELDALKSEKQEALAKVEKLQKEVINNVAKPTAETVTKTPQAAKKGFSPEIMNQLQKFVNQLQKNR